MLVIGHRGFPSKAPENTIPSFFYAIKAGVDYIELDVRRSKDGTLVVIHDETVDRTTDAKGYVSQYTVQELRSLDAGRWFSKEYEGTRIPTFEEVLSLASDETSVVVDIKDKGTEDAVLRSLRSFGMIEASMIVAPPEICRKIKLSEPKILVQADIEAFKTLVHNVSQLVRNKVDVASFKVHQVNREAVRYCHMNGLHVNVWPVNTIDDTLMCIRASADYVTTDNPQTVITTLRKASSKRL